MKKINENIRKTSILVLRLMTVALLFVSIVYASDPASLSLSLVSQNPSPAMAGDIVEVKIGIINDGGQAVNDLRVEFNPSYPFELVPGDNPVQDIGTMNAYQGAIGSTDMKIITYKVKVNKDTIGGQYEFKLKYSDGASGNIVQKSLYVAVSSRSNAEVIHIDKTLLTPGKQDTLTFRINNVGNSPLRDLTFYWTNDGNTILPVGSDNTRYMKYIEINNSTDLEYDVVADSNAAAGLYKLNLYLSYYDTLNNTQKTISTIAGVYVGGETDFDVALSDSSSGTTSLSIANIGSNPATSVSVSIPEQRGWTVTGTSSVIIGNLNKGDYTVASFKLQSGASTQQNRTRNSQNNGSGFGNMNVSNNPGELSVQLSYTDTTGARRIITKSIKVSAQMFSTNQTYAGRISSTQNQGFFTQYGMYIIILVILIVGYFVYKRVKNTKTSGQEKIKDFFSGKKK
jgi:hypothetical protein